MLVSSRLIVALAVGANVALTVAIAYAVRRKTVLSNDWLNASRSLSLWPVTLSFFAANCGALDIVGLCAMAAQYGAQAFHFYWIGAIPGMIFLALWMLPVYRRSGIRTLPEYLEERYDRRVRLMNACITATTMLMLSGINIYAMAQVLHVVFEISFALGAIISASTVLIPVLVGGVRATIYNEVFQLAVLGVGLCPLTIRILRLTNETGLSSMVRGQHLWAVLPLASMGRPLDVVGVTMGLGFVLSFSYWGTDFLLMQRALATRTDREARLVPILAGFGKLGFSFLVVLPGLAAWRLLPKLGSGMPFDQVLPALMMKLYGPVLLAVGVLALSASLMSGLSANISGFAAIWTEDIYRIWLRKGASEKHYLRVGATAATAAAIIGVLDSGLSFRFGNLTEHVQLVFSIFSAPFWAIFLLGMISRRASAPGALVGFASGVCVALFHQGMVFADVLRYGSVMNANFHAAIYGFLTTILIAWFASRNAPADVQVEVLRLTGFWTEVRNQPLLMVLTVLLAAICIALNVWWR